LNSQSHFNLDSYHISNSSKRKFKKKKKTLGLNPSLPPCKQAALQDCYLVSASRYLNYPPVCSTIGTKTRRRRATPGPRYAIHV
jgi:hypothetical protein